MIESHTPPRWPRLLFTCPLLPPHSLDSRYLASLATFACLGSHPPSAKKVVGYGFEKKKKSTHNKYKSHLTNPQNQNGVTNLNRRLGSGEILRGKVGKNSRRPRDQFCARRTQTDRSWCARGGHGGPRLGRQRGSVSFSVSTTSGTSSRSPSQVRNCLFFFFFTGSW